MPEQGRIIDLFAGAGGWDEGLRELGHRALGVDFDALACATAKAAGHERLHTDIASLDPSAFGPVWGLIGSPPCQAYSTAGLKAGRTDKPHVIACAHELAAGHDTRAERRDQCKDERSLLTVEPLRWAMELRPRWVALEQVPGVLELWTMFADLLAANGYQTTVGVLSAERYGVAQTRKRAYLIASLDGPVRLPEPTHRSYNSRRPTEVREDERHLLPWVSMADALGWPGGGTSWANNQTQGGKRPRGLSRSMDCPARTLDTASGSWTVERCEGRRHRDPATGSRCPHWTARRPATTILTKGLVSAPGARDRDPNWRPGDKWPSQWTGAERITPEQAAILQGFRRDYPWQGARTRQFAQIGNAVCPPVGRRVLAEAMAPSRRRRPQ